MRLRALVFVVSLASSAFVLGCGNSESTPGEGGLPEISNGPMNMCLDGTNASEGTCDDAGTDGGDAGDAGDDGSADGSAGASGSG